MYFYYLVFIDKETGSGRLNNLPEVTPLINGRAQIPTLASISWSHATTCRLRENRRRDSTWGGTGHIQGPSVGPPTPAPTNLPNHSGLEPRWVTL